MPRMIEVIRQSALPSNVMQFAAKGALLVPPAEMIEILVHLALHNKVFGEQAKLTLAGWDEGSAMTVAADPATPKEVLNYLIDPHNLRPALLPALLENSAVSEATLLTMTRRATREQVEALLKSERVKRLPAVLEVLLANPTIRQAEATAIKSSMSAPVTQTAPQEESAAQSVPEAPAVTAATEGPVAEAEADDASDAALEAFLAEHAAEIAGEEDKGFQPIAGVQEESSDSPEQPPDGAAAAAAAAAAGSAASATTARPAVGKKWILSSEEQRGTALQKIARLDIKGRIQLAMKGNKEERSLLVRDGTKIVALAVLDSPKLTDAEVEKFAGQKNVLEAVLRAIPMKRRFMKMYPVVRNLCFNPRTPIDVALGLIKNLLIQDLRHLSGNKEVSDTVRKLATKMFRQKLDVTKKS